MLDLRQRSVLSSDEQPTKLYSVVGAIDASDPTKKSNLKSEIMAKFVSSQAYGLDKINFSVFSQFYGLIEGCGFMLLGAYPYLWKMASDLGLKLGWTEADEIKVSCLFFVLMTLCGEATGLPLSIVSKIIHPANPPPPPRLNCDMMIHLSIVQLTAELTARHMNDTLFIRIAI